MARSYWGAYNPPFGKHPGIEVDDYCVPQDAYFVHCDMHSFTCKDMPAWLFKKEDVLQQELLPDEKEGERIKRNQIVPFLKFIKNFKKRYIPSYHTPKWALYPYKTLTFTRVDKEQFIIRGSDLFHRVNWISFLQYKKN